MDLLNNVHNIELVWVSEKSTFHSLDDKETLFINILYTSAGISSVTANQLFETIYNKNKHINVNSVIVCTGHKQSIPKFLMQSGVLNAEYENLLNDDFSCKTKMNTAGKIYIQNFARNLIGPIDSNLSIMPWRNALIINSILERSFYDHLDSEYCAFANLQNI